MYKCDGCGRHVTEDEAAGEWSMIARGPISEELDLVEDVDLCAKCSEQVLELLKGIRARSGPSP
jgi:DNA-directed RNA polymerase subunit RPC12/RpoP